jgi:hypothetical protein
MNSSGSNAPHVKLDLANNTSFLAATTSPIACHGDIAVICAPWYCISRMSMDGQNVLPRQDGELMPPETELLHSTFANLSFIQIAT